MRLMYVGQHPTTFRDATLPSGAMVRVGHLSPMDEFSVPDDVAESFLRRADIVEVTGDALPEDAKPARKVRTAPADDTPEAPTAQAAE